MSPAYSLSLPTAAPLTACTRAQKAAVLDRGALLPVRDGLSAGGSRMRTFGPAKSREASSVLVRPGFSAGRESSRGDMSRSRNLGRVTRYRWFESGFLQRGVCKLSVHRALPRSNQWRSRKRGRRIPIGSGSLRSPTLRQAAKMDERGQARGNPLSARWRIAGRLRSTLSRDP
jgi:hypothetical protein